MEDREKVKNLLSMLKAEDGGLNKLHGINDGFQLFQFHPLLLVGIIDVCINCDNALIGSAQVGEDK